MVTGRAAFRTERRAVLTAAGLMVAALPLRGTAAAAAAAPAQRLAAIDWAMLETAIAIGHMPVAASELLRFRADAVTPKTQVRDEVSAFVQKVGLICAVRTTVTSRRCLCGLVYFYFWDASPLSWRSTMDLPVPRRWDG